MPYFLLVYEVIDDYLERRGSFRAEHVALAGELAGRGELLLGGALEDPTDRAYLAFRVDDRAVVEAFVRRDPYVLNGLVTRWEIRPWRVVTGSAARPEDRPPI